jgi:hypothetical protein
MVCPAILYGISGSDDSGIGSYLEIVSKYSFSFRALKAYSPLQIAG